MSASTTRQTSSKSDLNIKIDNRASEFLHDTINARDLLDSGILCGATEEEILLAEEEKTNDVQQSNSISSSGTRSRPSRSSAQVPTEPAAAEMPQVVSGSQPVQKEKKYQCSTCYKKFPDMSSLKRHIPTHKKDQNPHVCGRCQKRFKSEDELTGHMKTHVQEKPYRCSVCSREFSVAQILKRHMLIHSGERAHECEYCGKRFTTKADVTRHVRIHTGEKPHKCPYCESRFVQAGQLKRHLVTHEKYQEQLRDGTLPEKPARKKTKPHKCTLCKAEFFHARQLQSHISFAHDNGGSDGASGSPQISPESRPVVGQNNLHSIDYADPLQADGEWKTYAPDPCTTDAGLSTTFPPEATPTIEWTDAPNPLTPQEMADLKPFIRISGHDDYAPPIGENADDDQNVQQPISASVAPQFVDANQLVQVDQSGGVKTAETVEYIGTTADGKTVIMDFIPTVVGETMPTAAITQPYVAVEAANYSQDQVAPKVNGDYIQVNQDGTILSVSPANGYYPANVVKSEVTEEEAPGEQPGDLMELTAVKLGDIQNGVPPEGALPGNVENHAGYIPISQSQEKTGFKFEWEMPMDKHSMPEASACMPIQPAPDVNQCMTVPVPAADSTGSIYLPVVPAESINKNYVPVTPEEINKQFGAVSIPAPIAEPINYSRSQDDPNAVQATQVQPVTEVAQPGIGTVVVADQAQGVVPPGTQGQQQQVVSATPVVEIAPAASAMASASGEETNSKEDQKQVSMLEELMLVLNGAPQNTEELEKEEQKPKPVKTEVTHRVENEEINEEIKTEVKTEDSKAAVPKVENSAEYQTIDKNCDIFGGDISDAKNESKAEVRPAGDLKIKIKIEAPSKAMVYKPRPKSKKKKEQQSAKKNVYVHQYVCKTCGDKFTTLGTLQKHYQKHEWEIKLRHGIDKECSVAMCKKMYNQEECEPNHLKIIDDLHKKKMEEKAAAKAKAEAEAKAQAEAEAEAASRMQATAEGEEDMEIPQNTLAGNEEFAGAHQCAQCGKSFTNPVILKAHMLLHSGKKPHNCPVCGKKFGTEAYMKGHLLIHTGEAPHKCRYCGKVFSMKGDLNRHVRSHTGEKPHKCEICGKNFTQSGDKKRHMLLQHEGMPTKIQLAQHKKSHKQKDSTAAAAERPARPSRPARRQSRRLSGDHKKSEDQSAENSSGERSPYKCAQCDKSFSHPRLLILHMRVHPAKAALMSKNTGNKCVDCGETFPSNDELKNHIMENHEQSLPYKCSVCTKEFSDIDQLEAHRKVHTGEAPYKCGQCNKTFCHVDNLNKHVASHTTEKLFKCKLCHEHFTMKHYLNKHLKSCHTEKKLFMCLACDKEFSEIAALKRHSVTHNHDKTHKCKLCSKAFKSRSGLNFHMLSHKNKHECTVCKKQFSLEIMLKNHMATHSASDSSSYSCAKDGCGAVFVTQEQLLRHNQKPHSTTAMAQISEAYDDDTEIETEEEGMETSAPPAAASFTCAKCNSTFSEFDQLKVHLAKHEEMEVDNNTEGTKQGIESEHAQESTINNDTSSLPSINNSNTNEGTSIEVGQS